MSRKGMYFLPDGSPVERMIDVIKPGSITSFVGGGGKTSSMLAMALDLVSCNASVIMTTTTRILPFSQEFPPGLRCIASMTPEGKLAPVENPDSLKKECDYLLIEADGSRGLPVKAPGLHEPVITPETDLIIALVGLGGIGRSINEAGHRVEELCHLLQKKPEDIITEEDVVRILLSEQGLHKNVGRRRYAVILNQADGEKERQIGMRIASLMPGEIPLLLSTYRYEMKE